VTPSPRFLALLLLGAVAACGRPQVPMPPAPASPEATVGQFLAAVNADDLRRMAQLFGDEKGPVAVTMHDPQTREQRMAILQRLLLGDSVHVLGTEPVPGEPRKRLLHLDLFRGDRGHPVPITVYEQVSGGWLVQKIELDQLLPGGGSGPTPP
jgi:hypothetical protein